MDAIVNTIIELEKECAGLIDASKSNHDTIINNLTIQIENKKKDEKKRITEENNDRYREEVEKAEKEISRELADMKIALNRLHENNTLHDEVGERILSVIF
jgi:hypothetical protein